MAKIRQPEKPVWMNGSVFEILFHQKSPFTYRSDMPMRAFGSAQREGRGQRPEDNMEHFNQRPETHGFVANVELPDDARARIINAAEGETVSFAIATDLDRDGSFATNYFSATDKAIYSFGADEDDVVRIPYSDIEKCFVKRCYGNALLRVCETNCSGEPGNFVRFTLSLAPIFDAAASFVLKMLETQSLDESFPIIEQTFIKLHCICKTCGRQLPNPQAKCPKCASKGRFIKTFGRYLLPYKWKLVNCLLLSVFITAISLFPTYANKILIDEAFPNKDINLLVYVVLGILAARFTQHSLGIVREYHLRICGDNIIKQLRSDVYRKAQFLPMRFYDRTSTGGVINRISGDTSTLQQFMLRITQEVVVQFFLLVGIAVIMFTLNWQLALITLAPIPFIVWLTRRFGKKIRPFYVKIWRKWADVTSALTDTIPGIRIVKAFAKEEKVIDKFDEKNQKWLNTDLASAKITIPFPHFTNMLASIATLAVWYFGGRAVIGDTGISAGLLVTFVSYTGSFYAPIHFFAGFNDTLQHAFAAAERIMDILDAEPEHDFAKGKLPEKLSGRIEFKNVNFSFDRAKKTLNNINFVIEPGDIVGIVGTTGSGKSTMINLLMRYYDGYDGQILMDGIDIRKIDMNFYRSQIGFVQQEPMMFRDTIYNNVSFGVDDVTPDDVIRACDIANAHEFIVRMPDGYDTLLGERGIGVSGGEKQRLSIARAVLKNPNILFFDEATASVDSETESLIQASIEALIQGRTTIMIAHRLSTLKRANKIIVVDNGSIIEMGAPEELMALKGKYYKLVKIQTMSEEAEKEKREERFV